MNSGGREFSSLAVTNETDAAMRGVRLKHHGHNGYANGDFQMSHLLVLAFIAIIAFGTQPSSLAVFKRARG